MNKYTTLFIVLLALFLIYKYTQTEDSLKLNSSVKEKTISMKNRVEESIIENHLENKQHSIESKVQQRDIPDENLTLESIEISNVGEEEKQRMLDDIAYLQSLETKNIKSLNENEIREIIIKDIEEENNFN